MSEYIKRYAFRQGDGKGRKVNQRGLSFPTPGGAVTWQSSQGLTKVSGVAPLCADKTLKTILGTENLNTFAGTSVHPG